MSAAAPTQPRRVEQGWMSDAPGAPALLFGVLLPLAAVIVEWITRMCAQSLFDPLPTLMHTVLVLLVPGINLATCWALQRGEAPRWLSLGNGVVIGVTAFYSVMFAPVLPIALIGVLFMGFGLLAWAPPLALITAWSLRRKLRAAAGDGSRRLTWPGVLCALLALIALDLPETVTRAGLRLAASTVPAEQVRGIGWLRSFGSEAALLRLCYVRTGRTTDLLSMMFGLHGVSPEQARQVYYRVTGTAFNAVPAPASVRRSERWDDFDFDQGTDAVGGRLQGLSLVSSRLDGSLDAEAALGYLEWTLVVKNDSRLQREARAQIALPPGAVVSRLTLWVNGEEREAAFAARGQVTAAYRSVVQQQRDPVLVTTAGADRIALQMFPVPPDAEMKVRIGMSMPLSLHGAHAARLQLPYFHERNFDLGPTLRHAVWIESQVAMSSLIASSHPRGEGHSLRLDLEDAALLGAPGRIQLLRTGRADSWARDGDTHLVRQTLVAAPLSAPARAVVVIDGSASMRPHLASLATVLAKLPGRMELVLIVADDTASSLPVTLTAKAVDGALRHHDFTGGHDNTLALAHGLDAVMSVPDAPLIWIHGPQPVLLQTAEAIEQRIVRGGKVSEWYDVQVTPGPNLLAAPLEALQRLRPLTLEDLESLFTAWGRGTSQWSAVRDRVAAPAKMTLPAEQQTSMHLTRLWASGAVARLLDQPDQRDSAIEIARQYQLVTPVSGAVVLETQAQYAAAGLTPVAAGTVPTIPEPHEWVLLVIAALLLGLTCWRERGVRAHAC